MTIPINPLLCMVRRFESQAHLSVDDGGALLALPFTKQALGEGSYIVREGQAPTHCCVLLSGFAYRQKTHSNGGRQILSIHIPGDILDLQNLFLDVSDHNVQTMTRSEVAFIPRPYLVDLFHGRSAIGKAILLSLLVEASISREWLLNVGRRDARGRVAHLLCEFASRINVPGEPVGSSCRLPMTQQQIGDAVGLTPVHVNRTLRSLETEGLLHRSNHSIGFPDWSGLLNAAGFSSLYLHADQQA